MTRETLFPEVLQAHVHYSGRVQGVGFRQQTLDCAREYEVAGFVRNLSDGRVELLAEGKASQVDAFLAQVENRLNGFIRKTERLNQNVVPSHQGFTIR